MTRPDPTRLRRTAWLMLAVLVAVAAVLLVGAASRPAAADPSPAPAPPVAPTVKPSVPAPSGSGKPSPSVSVTPSVSLPLDEEPAWYDLSGQVREAISDFLAWAVATGLNPLLQTLGETVLATPDLTGDDRVRQVWTGSLVVTNAAFVLLVILGGFVITSDGATQRGYGLREIAPRLALAAAAANMSLVVVAKAISVTNALTAAIAGRGVDPATAAAAIRESTENAMKFSGFLHSMLSLGLLVMAIVVVITFILRVMLLVALIGLAPLALACHALPQTEQLAFVWWRSLTACLLIQVGQTIVLVAGLRVFLTPTGETLLGIPASKNGLLGLLICLTMLWLLVKVPFWTKQYVLAGLTQQRGPGLFRQIIGTIIAVKTLGGLTRVLPRSGTRPRPIRRAAHPSTALAGRVTPRRTSGHKRPVRPVTASPAVRRRPGPVGPAEFTHAPTFHQPLPASAGHTDPEFSRPPAAAAPMKRPTGSAPAARFTDRPAPQAPPRPSGPAPAIRFTPPPQPAAPTARPAARPAAPPAVKPAAGTPAPQLFSHAGKPHTAPPRPPAPVTPVFSHPRPKPTPRRGHRRGGGSNPRK